MQTMISDLKKSGMNHGKIDLGHKKIPFVLYFCTQHICIYEYK